MTALFTIIAGLAFINAALDTYLAAVAMGAKNAEYGALSIAFTAMLVGSEWVAAMALLTLAQRA